MKKHSPKVICITGIDTDIGKTVVTGLLARYLHRQGVRVITQKICQTGCEGISEDILRHRELMGLPIQAEDEQGLTCPYVFREPCSPHLAAALEGVTIEPAKLSEATGKLAERYDTVLLEGVGGLMVPLSEDLLLVDYLQDFEYDHLLVSSARLGSINHTLSALEIMRLRRLRLRGIVYNTYLNTSNSITRDTRDVFSWHLAKERPDARLVDFGAYGETQVDEPDFSLLFK